MLHLVAAAKQPTIYGSDMHGETTQVEVFTRIADHLYREFPLGEMAMISLRCGTVSIRRDATDVRTRRTQMSTFIFQIGGGSTFSHYGHTIRLKEGDITLCNNGTLYDLCLEGRSEVLMFRVPTATISRSLPSPELMCGLLLAGDHGLASIATAMARAIAANEVAFTDSEKGRRAGQHLLDVLATSYLSLLDERQSQSLIMSTRFLRIKTFIEENLRDCRLKPAFIAHTMGVSDRYLRMIFALSGESPSVYILRRRLEECAAQLRNPRWQHHSITSIAFGWGFNSAPHFARTFRLRFRCSPSDYRHRSLA